MFKRLILVVAIIVAVLGLTAVYAGEEPLPEPMNGYIADGRLNGVDVAAPVAVFYKYDKVTKPGDWKAAKYEFQQLRGIELLWIDPKTNQGKLALEVSAADIAKLVDKAKHKDNTLIASKNGFALYYSSANWFWVSAPDKEGKTYTFKWQNLTVPHD